MSYISDDFLFNNETGKKLYLDYAKDMPIFDYHCHLSPQEIAEDKKYKNITEIWLGGDHYKWRAMRINGIEEKYITGDGDDYDKFYAFADTLDNAIGNPLYQWSHLELKRFFGIDKLLTKETAEEIWQEANEKLKSISARTLIKDSNVTHICTTDDPTDDLKYHEIIANDETFDVKVFPTFRPDAGFKMEKDGFLDWVNKLSSVCGIEINSLDDYLNALDQRIDFFNERGCKLADHGFEAFNYKYTTKEKAAEIFLARLNGEKTTKKDSIRFRSFLVTYLAKQYEEKNWTMQMHVGALRNNNTNMFEKIGVDAGFDTMGDWNSAEELNRYFDYLNTNDILPRTIVYNLNSKDNDVYASLMGNFPKENVPARVAFGTAWWFYDQKDGIEKQLTSFANLSVLGRFIGMVTDSRSFLSYTRHEYFRRVLCNLLGKWAEENMIPNDEKMLGELVKKISYTNAVEYFQM